MNGTDPSTRDEALETRSKAAFDASVSELDPNIRSRLRRARHAAIEQAEDSRRASWWIPALSTAAAAVLMMWLTPVFRQPQPQPSEALAARAEDMNLLMNEDNLELIEDMEFYAWLDETPGALDMPAEAERGAS